MNNDNSVIIIGVIVFIIILLMLIGAFLLLRSHKSSGSGKKVRIRKVKYKVKSSAPAKRSSAAGNTGKAAAQKAPAAKTAVRQASPGAKQAAKPSKPSRPVPLKGLDEGIEKYARMTEDYVRSKHGIELKRLELKKYFSDRHGFDCVDFTYRPASGALPAQFRTHLNDMDTALTNVSGADTLSFAVDNATGTYRTTFYLGKQ
ncbi:MAG: hypothetical protein IJT24_05470 [Lachnospiraceae bacterium]|nr:hypothetical protein [Lachnospiraceae bacterium]